MSAKFLIVSLFCIALSAIGCGRSLDSETPVHYQRFVLVQVEQPTQGCKDVMPCATVVLALDTKTGQVCRAAALHGENYPLCLHLYESYPDNKAEVERLKEQIIVRPTYRLTGLSTKSNQPPVRQMTRSVW